MKCPKCSHENDSSANFCAGCGTKLEKPSGGVAGIGDVGMIRAETINIGGAGEKHTAGDYCAICGLWVESEPRRII